MKYTMNNSANLLPNVSLFRSSLSKKNQKPKTNQKPNSEQAAQASRHLLYTQPSK
uniref:Uncharacterized protein n=1 Tax=Anguilla anguilla TaxID=7936 RepID=A0A0E9X5G4_ANGAN